MIAESRFSGANSARQAASLERRRIQGAGTVRHTSTKFFACSEIFGKDFREQLIQIANRKLCQVATL
jgi:hypothetical protein